jgi:electron transfer flavoprotein alpha/beta subunit
MKIAVCCKFTPDTEDIKVNPDGTLDAANANWGVSEYDLQAIQAAADMSAEDDEVVALTAGAGIIDQSKLTKELLSRGNLSALYRVVDNTLADADSATIAKALAALVQKAGADVVLFGEGSSDRYSRTMGAQVAGELGWPCVNSVDAVKATGRTIVADRDVEEGIEKVEMDLPCAFSVTSTINIPTTPGMKAVLAASKKPIESFNLADLAVSDTAAVQLVSSEVPEKPGRQQIVFEGTPEEMASQLVTSLQANGVL